MGKNEKTFKDELMEIRDYLKEKKQLQVLADRTGVTPRTVSNTFDLTNSFDELKGDRLNVYRNAIILMEEIKSLPDKATIVLNR